MYLDMWKGVKGRVVCIYLSIYLSLLTVGRVMSL